MRIALRFRLGARVIQLDSGCMPMISECACWLIWRMSVLRYASGIQSRGSMRESFAMRSSKSAWAASSCSSRLATLRSAGEVIVDSCVLAASGGACIRITNRSFS